jgi:PIN domain nuclease of toxin-antitoxin system
VPRPFNGLLLDTHTLFFLDSDPETLPPALLHDLSNPETRLFVSSLTAWEMGIKNAMGKWAEVAELLRDYHRTLIAYGCAELAFQSDAALLAGNLPPLHKDPFDRGLIAQATHHGLALVTQDELIHRYVGEVEGFMALWNPGDLAS